MVREWLSLKGEGRLFFLAKAKVVSDLAWLQICQPESASLHDSSEANWVLLYVPEVFDNGVSKSGQKILDMDSNLSSTESGGSFLKRCSTGIAPSVNQGSRLACAYQVGFCARGVKHAAPCRIQIGRATWEDFGL